MPKTDTRPLGAKHSWAQTPGTLISGKACIDGADHAAVTMELKWGVDRLRLLVSPELREKFDRQRYLFNAAVWHGDLEAVRREASRMASAWQALDKAATAAGASTMPTDFWEVALEDGTVAVILKDSGTPQRRQVRELTEGRQVAIYTIEEIGRLLSHYPQVAHAKKTFPGATVTAVRRPHDPLDDIRDTFGGLDDPIEDIFSPMGA